MIFCCAFYYVLAALKASMLKVTMLANVKVSMLDALKFQHLLLLKKCNVCWCKRCNVACHWLVIITIFLWWKVDLSDWLRALSSPNQPYYVEQDLYYKPYSWQMDQINDRYTKGCHKKKSKKSKWHSAPTNDNCTFVDLPRMPFQTNFQVLAVLFLDGVNTQKNRIINNARHNFVEVLFFLPSNM